MNKTTKHQNSIKKFFDSKNYLKSNFKILDAGCGSGDAIKGIINSAKKRNVVGLKFYGFDISNNMLNSFKKWVKEKNYSNIILKKADILKIEKLPSSWKNFDLIIASGMLEYVPKKDLLIAIKNLKNVLTKNGKIIIFISRSNLLNKIFIKKLWKANIYSKKELEKIIYEANLKIISMNKFKKWGYSIEMSNSSF